MTVFWVYLAGWLVAWFVIYWKALKDLYNEFPEQGWSAGDKFMCAMLATALAFVWPAIIPVMALMAIAHRAFRVLRI